MAHDICNKHRLTRFGGHGYAHILENVMPIMRRKGKFLAERELIRFWSENPGSGPCFYQPRIANLPTDPDPQLTEHKE